MLVKKLSYENFNGLTNSFSFSEKLNVFYGSNGCGKTTSLDALAILLFGESFSYNKTLERHINVKDKTQKAKLSMDIETGEKIVDEEGNEKNVAYNFAVELAYDKENKFRTTLFVNGAKTTVKDYKKVLYKLFHINEKYLDIDKINFLRVLIDPKEFSNSDNQAVYNLITELKYVKSLESFAKENKEYDPIKEVLYKSFWDIKTATQSLNTEISNIDNELKYLQNEKDEVKEELEKNTFDENKYNSEVDKNNENAKKYRDLIQKTEELQNKYKELEQKNIENLLLELKKLAKEKEEIIHLVQEKKHNLYSVTEWQLKEITTRKMPENYSQLTKYKELQKDLEKEKFVFEEIICQECGKVANSKDKELALAKYEKEKKEKEIYFKDLIAKINKEKEELKSEYESIVQNQNKLQEEIDKLISQSSEYDEKINQQNNAISSKEKSKEMLDVEKEISQLNEEKTTLLNDSKETSDYLQQSINIIENIKKLNNRKKEISEKAKKLLDTKSNDELKLNILKSLNIAYAKYIEDCLSDIFGEIKINLVKEGKSAGKEKISCYAVQDEKPIYNYNTAPQISFGCKIIQKIKQSLGIVGMPILFDIVDNIGEKSLNEILSLSTNQLFCTKAAFEENKNLKLVNNIKEIK